MRDPESRYYSHYINTKRDENEKLSFLDSLEKEEERLKCFRDNNDVVSFSRFSYYYSSMYGLHLKEYFNKFNKNQFCIVLFDDFVKERQKTIQRILKFLEVDEKIDLNIDIKINPASTARSVKLKKFMCQF